MNGFGQMRSASEMLAQRVVDQVVDLVVNSLDVNELAQQVDVNTLLRQVDLNAVVAKIDVNALLGQVDVNRLITQVDIEAVIERTDLGGVIAMSSGHELSKAVDVVRGQAVALDGRIDRWVRRLLRRTEPGPITPPALRNAEART
ncbi:MAG TPA: hypothetical protein VK817_08895 [Trebonia sp.]|jgi:hypothetical protein|nr:hypothetical protein [Trebonia sp.]